MTTAFDKIGGYCLVHFIGRGGMGEVWSCVKPETSAPYAIKILQPGLAEAQDFPKMFRREAAIGAQLGRHRTIVGVHDFGEQVLPDEPEPTRLLYLVMDFVDGVNLRRLIHAARKKFGLRLPLPIVAHIARVVLRALDAAHGHRIGKHRASVVHGDINPGNVLISSFGEVTLTDFGIARVAPAETWVSQPMGTLRYMAPEQLMGRICPGNDLYGVGGLIHECLTGRAPLSVQGSSADLHTALFDAPIEPHGRDDVPEALERVRVGLLQKRLEDRIPTAADAIDMLADYSRVDSLEDLRTLYLKVIGEPRSGLTRYLQESPGGPGSFVVAMMQRRLSQMTGPQAAARERPEPDAWRPPRARPLEREPDAPWAARDADDAGPVHGVREQGAASSEVPNDEPVSVRTQALGSDAFGRVASRADEQEPAVEPTAVMDPPAFVVATRRVGPPPGMRKAPAVPVPTVVPDSDGVPIHYHRARQATRGVQIPTPPRPMRAAAPAPASSSAPPRRVVRDDLAVTSPHARSATPIEAPAPAPPPGRKQAVPTLVWFVILAVSSVGIGALAATRCIAASQSYPAEEGARP